MRALPINSTGHPVSPEQRYRNAVRKARIRSQRDLRAFLAGEIGVLATSEFERQEIIAAIARAYADGERSVGCTDPVTLAVAHQWIAGGDTGLSSIGIWSHMMGTVPRDGFRHPRDPSDFGRCERLLRAIPAWRPRLPEMAQHGGKWLALASRWAEVVDCMEGEVGIYWEKEQVARRTYDLIKEIIQ